MKKGFTLIELLVVVLIIGVLTAVALPKYQVAVQKSRYATLMPIAKSVKNAEESVLMANGSYTETLSDLSVTVPTGTDVTITPKSDDNESYVRAEKTGLDNRLVMYFARSPRYSNEIHCEAVQENDRAKQICLSLGAKTTPVDGTADSTGYDTYVLEGTGATAGAISSGGSSSSGPSWANNSPLTETLSDNVLFGLAYNGFELGEGNTLTDVAEYITSWTADYSNDAIASVELLDSDNIQITYNDDSQIVFSFDRYAEDKIGDTPFDSGAYFPVAICHPAEDWCEVL